MNAKTRRELNRRRARLDKRIDKANWNGKSPMLDPPSIEYELAERTQAVSAGGIGLVQQLVKRLDLATSINRGCPVLKLHLPYSEADHVLNIAYNLMAGGTCLDHLETRRTDEAWLNALGAQRIPDPTTAGDFCRRFDGWRVYQLMESINEARARVWQEQPPEFLDEAVIEVDGVMVETQGERKEGIAMNYERKWGYHPLLVTLAHTREVLYLVNRPGNRPSHEKAATFLDRAIDVCRRGGFRAIKLRGDTDFSQTAHLDRWDDEGVKFLFGIDAHAKLAGIAEELAASRWSELKRPDRPQGKPRARRPNYKQALVARKKYLTKRLRREWVAEFDYQPHKCCRPYRVVVLRKEVEVSAGQQKLFDESPYFFFITNIREGSPASIVLDANQRCDQENIHAQLKSMGALAAPLDTLNSNWAYMVMATLAWNLKCWLALSMSERGPASARSQRQKEKRQILRMDFSTFRQRILLIPAQIVASGRRLIYRLLTWTAQVDVLFRLRDSLARPLRQ